MTDQHAQLEWKNGVPIATRFDDPYYSLDNGLAETRHVFLAGNDLPARFCDGFHIAELGFGTGLNFLTTAQAWLQENLIGTLHFTSFEAFPINKDEMRRALEPFGELKDLAQDLTDAWPRTGPLKFHNIHLTIIEGDARESLPKWDNLADAWFLDGFSPAKNPELWEPDLLKAVGDHTNAGGTAATYSAAGHVRNALAAAGFEVTRTQGFGRKRHMTRARKP